MNVYSQVRVEEGRYLELGAHVVDTDTLRIVTLPDTRLTPKAAAVLVRLAHAAGRTLSRDELLDAVWKGTCPTPDVLTQAITDLRRALGDDLRSPRYIETLPRLGYRLIAPARFMAETVVVAMSSTTPAANPLPPARLPLSTAPRQRLVALGAAAIAASALIGAAILVARKPQVESVAAVTHWRASAQRSITAEPGPENFPHVSPDGTRVAYTTGDAEAGRARIMQKSMDQSHVVRVSALEKGNEYYPVWSPDGASIAFMRYDEHDECSIIMIPALGGAERVLQPCYAGLVNPFSWSPDGQRIVTTNPSRPGVTDMAIVSSPIDASEPQWLVYAHALSETDLDPRYSPDGAWIAFRRGANPYSDLFLVSAMGGAVRQLTHLATRIRGHDWTRDGSALVFSSGNGGQQALFTVDIADAHIEPLEVRPAEFPNSARSSDAVVYEIPRVRMQLAEVAFGAAGPPVERVPSTGSDSTPALSPVNDDLAFISDRSGSQQLWLREAASGETFALTDISEPTLRYPVWRADGRRLLVTVREGASGRLIEIDIASHARHVLTAPDEDVRNGAYGLRPGTFIAVVNAPDHRSELIEFGNAGNGEAARRVLAHDVARADSDPAAGALYFTRITEAGLFKLDGPSGVVTLLTRAIHPSHLDGWRVHDGKVVYFAPQATGPSEVRVRDPQTDDDRAVATVPGSIGDLNFSVARDGRHVVIARTVSEDTDIGAINLARAGAH